jgi:DNA-binding NarL/FixJ family response regulator
MATRTLRLLLASEDERAGASARRMIESVPEFSLVGKTRLDDETAALARTTRPHAVIVHVSAAEPTALEAIRCLAHGSPETRLLVLADQHREETVHEALRAGATAVLSGAVTAAEIRTAVQATMHDGIYLGSLARKAFVISCLRCIRKTAGPMPLTSRQREVLLLIAEGRSTKQIAARLRISFKTVETHRAHIMRRLNIYDVAGLVRYAIRQGLVQPDA